MSDVETLKEQLAAERRMRAVANKQMEQALRERDEARERARHLAAGEVITTGIARLVDSQTATLIEKAKAQRERAEKAEARVAELERERDEQHEGWKKSAAQCAEALELAMFNRARAERAEADAARKGAALKAMLDAHGERDGFQPGRIVTCMCSACRQACAALAGEEAK